LNGKYKKTRSLVRALKNNFRLEVKSFWIEIGLTKRSFQRDKLVIEKFLIKKKKLTDIGF
jgi:hypothetical protein